MMRNSINGITEKRDASSRRILFFALMLVIGAAMIVLYLIVTGGDVQEYTDVITEYLSCIGSNKSNERLMVFLFSFLGILLYILFYFKTQRDEVFVSNGYDAKKLQSDDYKYALLIPSTMAVVYLLFYMRLNWLLCGGLLVTVMALAVKKTVTVSTISFFYIGSYALIGCYRIYAILGGRQSLSMAYTVLTMVIICVILLTQVKKKNDILERAILVSAVFVPFTFLNYFVSTYEYKGKLYKVDVPISIKIVIGIVITLCVTQSIVVLVSNRKKPEVELKNAITVGTCISILSFNMFEGTGAIANLDLHHDFENVIGYTQIFKYGQIPYKDYLPVSGLYSVIQGFFFEVFGSGNVANYQITENLFYLVISILVILLLSKHVSTQCLLMLALFMDTTGNLYNRVVFIIPIVLLLSWKKIIDRKNLWLMTWFLTSLFHGLYYPAFGAAVGLGFLPLGIYQIVTYVRTGEIKSDIKKTSFWIHWGLCVALFVLSITLLNGTLKHTLAMSCQTVYSDGLSRFGQEPAEVFMPYLGNSPVRMIFWDILTFLPLIAVVWISIALCLKIGDIKFEDKKITLKNPIDVCICVSLAIIVPVSCSYTIVRLDFGELYSRNMGIIFLAFVLLIIISIRMLDKGKSRDFVLIFAVCIIAVSSRAGLLQVDSSVNFKPFYKVPEESVYTGNDKIEKIRNCFITESTYSEIVSMYDYGRKLNQNDCYLGLYKNYGTYYMCEMKGGGSIELSPTIRGYEATKEAVDYLRRNQIVVGPNLFPDTDYYLYYWLINSGEYIWKADISCFVPNDGSMTKEEVIANNRAYNQGEDFFVMGRTPSSWGESIDLLGQIFSTVPVNCTLSEADNITVLDFESPLYGSDADFLYIEFFDPGEEVSYFETNLGAWINVDAAAYPFTKHLLQKEWNESKILNFIWEGEDSQYGASCNMGRGKLLIPLGTAKHWLTDEHNRLLIYMSDKTGNQYNIPQIKGAGFLKLREVP